MSSKILKAHLLVIDPQNDFCDITGAALPVPGANADMGRLAALVDRVGHKLDDIHVTLDSHHRIDIAHPGYWTNAQGKKPSPFTIITASDIKAGIWMPRIPGLREWVITYTETLAGSKNQYPLMIWPEHCLIGTWGHNVHAKFNDALQRWTEKEIASVRYVTKGSNPHTEHYGGLMAEVTRSDDPDTLLNTTLLETIAEADLIGVAGEASSHCVLTTVNQIVDNIGSDHLKKFHLITDCMSPVGQAPGGPDFPAIAAAWIQDMQKLGMQLTTSTNFLA